MATLDSLVEAAVISEVDLFSVSNEKEFILLRFLNDEEFALYEPDMFEDLGSVKIHRQRLGPRMNGKRSTGKEQKRSLGNGNKYHSHGRR